MDDNKFKTVVNSWIGTPWRHYQRIKGSGVDCAWFVLETAKEMGWADKSLMLPWYPQDFAQHRSVSGVIAALEKECLRIAPEEMQCGDILCYKYGRCASHVGLYMGEGLGVHAHIVRGVEYFPLTEIHDRFHSVWRISCRS